MNPEDKKEEQISAGDPFSLFMFGPNQRNTDLKREPVESSTENKKLNNSSLDDWLFGNQRKPESTKNKAINDQINQIINNIDFIALMDNIDALKQSAQQFKPIYSKVTPMIKQLFKKSN
ncbi:hypothetical protein [Bacillus sp. S/N-304-OC-R1]|uniref:hypothetical protein n=1 Tax=Bacillus sp. S/N-304-OC-R1 TaxID=2758034 RepID=UPI001C8D1DF9|nr:hypothetical protein [Bacillus sp. S/N-304-OC-R1]MBY0121034.1 hypothetical protein [Bacillus sp. S/N-304-OC-R1]